MTSAHSFPRMLEHVVRYKEVRSSTTEVVVTERFNDLSAAQWNWDELNRVARSGTYPKIALLTARPGSDQYIHTQFLSNRQRKPR